METTVCAVTFACEWVFLSAHDMMTSVAVTPLATREKSVCEPLREFNFWISFFGDTNMAAVTSCENSNRAYFQDTDMVCDNNMAAVTS